MFSVRMRAEKNKKHISGAETLVEKTKDPTMFQPG